MLFAAVATGIGLGLGLLLRRATRWRARLAAALRLLAAGGGSAVALAFAAGVVGVVASGGGRAVPVLIVFSLALLGATALLWRGPARHRGVAGHWLGALWWMLSALRAGSPVLAGLFIPVGVLGLLAAGFESPAAPQPGEAKGRVDRA